MKNNIGIFWLREDFRLARNSALYYATKNHKNVVALYIYKETKFKDKNAQKWWIYKSLENFRKTLISYNINLQIIKSENYKKIFDEIALKKNVSIYWNKIYEPDYLKFDDYLKKIFAEKNIEYKIFKGNILSEFTETTKKDGSPFKVFTPFWRNAERIYQDKIPSLENNLKKCEKKILLFKHEIKENKILSNNEWYKKFDKIWDPCEKSALKQLNIFLKNSIENYSENRNFPNIIGTSKLSPYIKHGQIHVETIWKEANNYKKNSLGKKKFLAEIGWREFSHSLINFFPNMLKGNFSKKFDKFPWNRDKTNLLKWKKGITGYPIVDAGMRELYSTGWMHNRVRMIVGSFLVKHLLIDWRDGEKYFRDSLHDFNEANNVSGWQWVAGCGADAAPYFRIFNPILQGEKFDKNGDYVKKWIPELNNVPKKFIHKPWEYTESLDFKIGRDYPAPIVEHNFARKRALNAFKSLK